MAKRRENSTLKQQSTNPNEIAGLVKPPPIEFVSTLNTGDLFDPENPATSLFKFPIAITQAVWNQCLKIPARNGSHDFDHALWNVLWTLKVAVERSTGGSVLTYSLHVPIKNRRAKLLRLKARCGPFATSVPFIKIMTPDEDRLAS